MPIPRTTRGNKYGIRGVHLYRKHLFRVRIVVRNETIHVGDVRTLAEAARLRHAAERYYRPGYPLSEIHPPR